jgi:bifunctional UDP-N-acetylglucosamine pyrophosphorylase/glucosamine-1-phosphate N-acetyltransferase
MAGGLGKRMKSDKPKVLNLLNGFPLIYYVIRAAISAGSGNVLLVIGKYKEMIKNEIEELLSIFTDKIHYITQPEILIDGELKVQGTGDAIKCCLPFFINKQTQSTEYFK